MRFRPLGFDTTSGVTGISGGGFGSILLVAVLAVALPAGPARAQAGRLDEAQFVEGLRQYGLSSLLEHYLKNNQIKDPLVRAQVNVEVARWQFERAVAKGSDDAEQRGEAVVKAYQALFEAAPVTDHRQPIWGTEYSIFILEQFLPQAHINAPEFVQFGSPKPSQRRAFDGLTAQAVEAMELAGDDLTVLLGRLPRRDDFVQKYQNTGVYQELQEKWDGLMIPYYRAWAYLYGSYLPKARPQRLQAADRDLQRLAGNKRLNKAFLPKVLSLRGRVLLRLKKPTEAIKFLDAAMKSPAMPAFDRLVATLAKSEALNQQAKKSDALKVLDAIRTDGRMGRMVNATPVLLILIYDRRFEITKDFLVYNRLLEDKVVVANKWQQSIKRWMGERVEGPVPSAQELAKEEPFIVLIWADKLIQRGQDAKAKAEETADDEQKQKLLAEAEGQLKRAGQEMKALLKRPKLDTSLSADALSKLGFAEYHRNARFDAATAWADLAEKHPQLKMSSDAAVNAVIVAESLYEELKKDPKFRKAVTDLFDRCLTVLHEKYPDHPRAKTAWYTRAAFERDRGQLEAAIPAYQKVSADQPLYANSLYEMAYCRFKLATSGDEKLAAEHAGKAVAACELAKPVLAKAARAGGEQGRKYLQGLGDTVLWKSEIQVELLKNAPAAFAALDGFDNQFASFPDLINDKRKLIIKVFIALSRITDAEKEIDKLKAEAPDQVGPVLKNVLDSVSRLIEQSRLLGKPDEAKSLATVGTRLARKLLEWAQAQPKFAKNPDDLLFFESLVADQLTAAEAHDEVIKLYTDLLAKPFGGNKPDGTPVTGADRLDVVYGLAKAYFAAGDHEKAKPLIYALQDPKESKALLKRRDVYWGSWLMRCEVRDAEYAAHKKAGEDEEAARAGSDVFRWVRKLEFGTENKGTPQEMGGGKTRQRFIELKVKHQPK